MKFGLNPSEALVLREALMSYRNRHAEEQFREPPDGFRVSAADDLLGRLDALARIETAQVDEAAVIASKRLALQECECIGRSLGGHSDGCYLREARPFA